jgi:hypothetical protein
MDSVRRCAIALSVLGLGACSTEYHLMTTPGAKVAPAGNDCDFAVSKGLPPAVDYVEIGRLEAEFSPASTLDALKTAVHDPVCSIGGELVVGEWNGDHFMAAIIYRRRGAPNASAGR